MADNMNVNADLEYYVRAAKFISAGNILLNGYEIIPAEIGKDVINAVHAHAVNSATEKLNSNSFGNDIISMLNSMVLRSIANDNAVVFSGMIIKAGAGQLLSDETRRIAALYSLSLKSPENCLRMLSTAHKTDNVKEVVRGNGHVARNAGARRLRA